VAASPPFFKYFHTFMGGQAVGHTLLGCVARSVLPAATLAKPFFLVDGGWV